MCLFGWSWTDGSERIGDSIIWLSYGCLSSYAKMPGKAAQGGIRCWDKFQSFLPYSILLELAERPPLSFDDSNNAIFWTKSESGWYHTFSTYSRLNEWWLLQGHSGKEYGSAMQHRESHWKAGHQGLHTNARGCGKQPYMPLGTIWQPVKFGARWSQHCKKNSMDVRSWEIEVIHCGREDNKWAHLLVWNALQKKNAVGVSLPEFIKIKRGNCIYKQSFVV